MLQRQAHRPAPSDPGAPVLPARLANTSVSEVAADAPHTVLRVDCTAHLDAPDPHGPAGGAA